MISQKKKIKKRDLNLAATKADLQNLVTKEEFKAGVAKLATKEELKKLATKEELKKLATKEELKKLATKEELTRTELTLRAGIQHDFDDFREEINAKIGLLPTKDEFFGKMDEVMGELKSLREEHTLDSAKISEYSDTLEDHETRILVLEQKVGSTG